MHVVTIEIARAKAPLLCRLCARVRALAPPIVAHVRGTSHTRLNYLSLSARVAATRKQARGSLNKLNPPRTGRLKLRRDLFH